MKRAFFTILLLNIYTGNLNLVFGQHLYLEISGNNTEEDAVIEKMDFLKIFSNYNALEKELDSVIKKTHRAGYIESRIFDFSKKNDSTYAATLHLNTLYREIKIFLPDSSLFVFDKNMLYPFAKKTEPSFFIINFTDTEYILSSLNATLAEGGDTFASLQLINIKPSQEEKTLLEADLTVTTGEKRKITEIRIMGYEKFPRSFLKYAIGLKEGMIFSKQQVSDKSYLLENLGFVKNTKPPEVLFTSKETEIYLYLEKRNNNLFDGILGFATNEDTGKLELNGYLNLILSNNLNFGEKLILNYKNDGGEQEQFYIKAELPFLFKTPFGLEAELNLFKRDSTFINIEQSLLANYQLNTKTKLFSGYRSIQSENLLNNTALLNDVEDFKSTFGVFGISYINPQNSRLFPGKTRIQTTNDIGTRKRSNQNARQFRTHNIANHIFNLNYQNSIYIGNTTAIIFSNNYFTNELFRFGGINNIRGFNENSIDASMFSVLNTEYRYLLNPESYIHSIIDFAYFENAITSTKANLYSFGFGIGLHTKAGTLRLNIANGKQDSQAFRFSNTKIHLSLNTQF